MTSGTLAETAVGTSRRRCAIYVRISKDVRDEAGVQRQEEECRDRAAALGWEVAAVYVDNDVEASSGKPRPSYQRMLDDMKAGRVNAVIGWHSDRIYRRPDELEDLIKIADAHDVMFSAVRVGHIDLSTASGRLVARLLGATAKYETELKGERQAAQIKQLVKEGKHNGGGSRPFGYEQGYSATRPDEAAVIRELAGRYLAGESLNALAAWLSETGVTTVRGGKWQPVVLRQMLGNPRLAGLATYKGTVVGKATWEPILDEDTHRRIVAKLNRPDRSKQGRSGRVAVLAGLIWCDCGYQLVTSQVKRRRPDQPYDRVYACRTRYLPGRDGYQKACGRILVKASNVEDDVAERVLGRLARPSSARRIADAAATAPSGAADGSLMLELEERLRQLGLDYADGLIGRPEFLSARDRVTDRLRALEAKAAQRTPRLDLPYGDPAKLAEWWDGATFALRQALVQQNVDRVVVRPHQGRRDVYSPSRVVVEWR